MTMNITVHKKYINELIIQGGYYKI